MKRLLLILIFAASAYAQTPVDAILTLRPESGASTPGTQMTSTIMTAGTFGSSLAWTFESGNTAAFTVGAHVPGCELSSTLSTGGVNYPPATPSQSFGYLNSSTGFSNYVATFPAGKRVMTISGCIKTNAAGLISNLYDMMTVYDTQGHFVCFQMRNSNQIELETDGAGTIHSGFITVAQGGVYRFTFQINENTGTASLALFQPQFPYTQVGTTQTVQQQTGRDIQRMRFGNNEVGTANSTTFFENVSFDWTSAAFPGQVGTQYAPWAGIIAPTRATNWSGAGVVGGIPARTTNCSTLSPGATAAQIVSALNTCPAGQTVFLNAGTYNISGLNVPKSSITLRGAGADQTFLVATSNIGSPCSVNGTFICISASDNNFKSSPSNLTNWTSGYLEGATVINLAAVPNLKVGNILMVDQLDDTCDAGGIIVSTATTPCTPTAPGISGPYSLEDNGGGNQRSGRSQLQVLTVKGCGSVTTVGALCTGTNVAVTVDPPLRMPNWRASQTPQAWWATNPIHDVGIENMSIDGTAILGTGIQIKNGYNNWVKGTRIIDTDRAHVQDSYASHNTVRDNYMFLSQKGGQQSYGFECFVGADDLIENNIFHAITGPVLMNGACMGEVVSYNYAINMWYTVSAGWDDPMSSVHTAGVSHVLYEGNVSNGVESDVFHGTHYFVTPFRNRFSGTQAATFGGPNQVDGTRTDNLFPGASYIPANNNQYVFRTESFSRGYNFLANVMGTTGITNTYQNTKPGIFEVGIGNNNSTTTVASDPNTGSSMMRYGNLDNVHGYTSPQFVASEIPTAPPAPQVPFANFTPNLGNTGSGQPAFPASFFYVSKPSWWPATKAWPPIGPDVTGGNIANVGGHAFTNPAQDCAGLIGINANGTNGAQTFNASTCFGGGGGGGTPVAQVLPTSLTFTGQQVSSVSPAQTVTVANIGTASMTISSITISGSFGQTNNCTGSLAIGNSCTVNVTFSPNTSGSAVGTLVINDNASGSPHTVSLSGTGIQGNAGYSPISLTFTSQNVGTMSAPQGVVMTNTGTAPLSIASISTSGDFAQSNNCPLSPSTLSVGATCTINVTFSPTATGTRSGLITVADNANVSPQILSLNGTGAPGGAVSFSPVSITFSGQTINTTSAQQSTVLSNSGTGPLTVSGISVSGAFAMSHNCPLSPSTIAAGGSCTINATFMPTAIGVVSGNVTVTSNAAASPQTVPLSGTGQAAATCGGSISSGGFIISGGVQFNCPLAFNFGSTLNPFIHNGSACIGNGATHAGCSSAFLGLSTDTANTNALTQVVDPAPANYSTLDAHTYLYSGNTTRVGVHWQPWFVPSNSHISVGYNENLATTVTAQLAAMHALGIDFVVPDYYGNDPSKSKNLASVDAMATSIAANPTVSPKMMLGMDSGAWSNPGQCPKGSGITTVQMEACIEGQLDYAAQHYLYQSWYETEGGSPLVSFFLDETSWSSVNFDTVWPHVHAHVAAGQLCGGGCTYLTSVLLLGRNSGSITRVGLDGSFAWSPTQAYNNASPSTQLDWNGTSSYLDNFYSIARANPAKTVMGLIYKGFDDSVPGSFGTGKIVAQRCGQVFKLTADKIAAAGYNSGSQLKRVQIQTWNDYEEGTEIETGVDNCYSISASAVGTTLNWTITATDATYSTSSTVDHLRVIYCSGTSCIVLTDNIPFAQVSASLAGIPLGTWTVYLQMVDKSMVINHLSNPVTYTSS